MMDRTVKVSDCISRQIAIDLIKSWSGGYDYIEIPTDAAIKSFSLLPSAQRTGRWIPVAGRMGKEVQCDCCGEVFWYWLTNFTYCPNCGARMEEQE